MSGKRGAPCRWVTRGTRRVLHPAAGIGVGTAHGRVVPESPVAQTLNLRELSSASLASASPALRLDLARSGSVRLIKSRSRGVVGTLGRDGVLPCRAFLPAPPAERAPASRTRYANSGNQSQRQVDAQAPTTARGQTRGANRLISASPCASGYAGGGDVGGLARVSTGSQQHGLYCTAIRISTSTHASTVSQEGWATGHA